MRFGFFLILPANCFFFALFSVLVYSCAVDYCQCASRGALLATARLPQPILWNWSFFWCIDESFTSLFVVAHFHEHTHYAWIELQEMGCSPTQILYLFYRSHFRLRFTVVCLLFCSILLRFHVCIISLVHMSLTQMGNSNKRETKSIGHIWFL